MRTKKILLLLALLCAVVQGVWSQNGIYCTASDVGRVVCTDGSIYDNVAEATAANKTAAAKIIWVDETNKKGMALALQDEGTRNMQSAIETCAGKNTSRPVAGATWKLASQDEWNTMVTAAGGHATLRNGFSSVGGTDMAWKYWSSTRYDIMNGMTLLIDDGSWGYTMPTDQCAVRACLVFDLLTLYTIGSRAEWETFCAAVNSGDTFSDKYVKLTDDITVSEMVGASDGNSFQGFFDGNGHTLTFNKGTAASAFNEEYCAPFRHVKNAVIKNLCVNGQMYTSAKYAAGFVGESHGNLTIDNCCSSVGIHGSKSGDGFHGGFVAMLSGTDNTIVIDNCIFDGEFTTTNGTNGCGGFIGWTNYIKNH